MIDHFGISCTDPAARAAFWIARSEGGEPDREVHVAFTAPDAGTVRALHAAGNNVEAVCHTVFEG